MRDFIDCDVSPFTPRGWSVEVHQKSGKIIWDPNKVELWLSPNQRGRKLIKGGELRQEVCLQPVCNANVLDYLLANPHLIPKEWKKKKVFFWGTIYSGKSGVPCVRCLYWYANYDIWVWVDYSLVVDWSDKFPAATFRQ